MLIYYPKNLLDLESSHLIFMTIIYMAISPQSILMCQPLTVFPVLFHITTLINTISPLYLLSPKKQNLKQTIKSLLHLTRERQWRVR